MPRNYDAQYAMELFGQRRYTEVFDYCSTFAEEGLASAQCLLGNLYQLGLGVACDPHTAERLYRKSAEQDFPVAWCNLGTLHASGVLGSVDDVEAGRCYRRAAELGGPSHADYLAVEDGEQNRGPA